MYFMEKNSETGIHGTGTDKKELVFSTHVFYQCDCTAMMMYYLKDQKQMTHARILKSIYLTKAWTKKKKCIPSLKTMQ